jgi:glyoxylase-like metal-dependent hydrolase (beta-lactamase superfamily II)/8-oxo-dGTP pyrophosphatase MutT (NUDIX family)
MAFAADVHVFPGGGIDPDDGDASLLARCDPDTAEPVRVAAIREVLEEAGVLLGSPAGSEPPSLEAVASARSALVSGAASFVEVCADLDVHLATDRLVPLSRWVTPPILARRFDARIFAAELPSAVEVSVSGSEVVALEWLTPRGALAALADGRIRLWLPTSTTLQRLEHVRALDPSTAGLLAPGRAGPPTVSEVAPDVIRVEQPSGAGVDGLTVDAYLVGGRDLVAVDPGDPSEEALLAIVEAASRIGTIGAVALTSADPDHAGGSEHLREGLSINVLAGPGAGRSLPFPVVELADGAAVPAGDVRLVAMQAPGPRFDHVVYWIPASRSVIAGDLVGPPAARSVPGPSDLAAWQRSLERVGALEAVRLLPAHGDPVDGRARVAEAVADALDAVSRGATPRAGSGAG